MAPDGIRFDPTGQGPETGRCPFYQPGPGIRQSPAGGWEPVARPPIMSWDVPKNAMRTGVQKTCKLPFTLFWGNRHVFTAGTPRGDARRAAAGPVPVAPAAAERSGRPAPEQGGDGRGHPALSHGRRSGGQRCRSQAQNRQVALSRLRVRLALEVRVPVDASRVPSPLWRSREHGRRHGGQPRP